MGEREGVVQPTVGERKKEQMILHIPKMKNKTKFLSKFKDNLIATMLSERGENVLRIVGVLINSLEK